MPRNWSFWRNVAIIGTVHAVVLFGFARWSGSAKKPVATDILWMMDGGEALASSSVIPSPPASSETIQSTPPPAAPEDEVTQPPPDEPAVALPAKSEIEQPSPTPLPRPTVTPTPRRANASTPTPKPRSEAKTTPSPRATPKPTPKKTLVAKRATPGAKPTATPVKTKAAASEAKEVAVSPAPLTNASPGADDGDSATSGSSGHGSGPGGASQFGSYNKMLHDRFFNEWNQPTSVVASGAKMSVLVRLRIEKDGRVSDFTVARPSGNVVVDESVAAVAKRVTKVDPLPAGLGSNGHYDVNINFELNRE